MTLNHTHDSNALSWIASANGHPDFPIQNLPIAIMRRIGSSEAFRGGIAIGDQVIDLGALNQLISSKAQLLSGAAADACAAASASTLNQYMSLGAGAWSALRHQLFALLKDDSTAAQRTTIETCLIQQDQVEFGLAAQIGDYTDFYTSIHHARNVGRIARPDSDPLTPNFQWLPIAYHGRASSVVTSGTPFHRPMGQLKGPTDIQPRHGACERLDFELELGFFIGPGNQHGKAIPIAEAEQQIVGVCLLNDWSARDIQFWEMAPLGPFLGKNFCTSISPWIVSLEALAPFRLPFQRPLDEPQVLAYLDSAPNRMAGVFDIQLEVLLDTELSSKNGTSATQISRTSFKHQYWTLAQMVAQHSSGGCNLQAGDLIGTGTISGPSATECGAIIELTKGGREPVSLSGGEKRAFLQNGDTVSLHGWCEKDGFARIGFGFCSGTVLPAHA
jgi:fumarylacetoacetase